MISSCRSEMLIPTSKVAMDCLVRRCYGSTIKRVSLRFGAQFCCYALFIRFAVLGMLQDGPSGILPTYFNCPRNLEPLESTLI
jgi:hypothetical protein